MEKIKWRFPLSFGGAQKGISDSGIESFTGNRIESLTREICQNSLDAKRETKKSVFIEFKEFYIDKNDFPDIEKFKWAVDKSSKTKNAKQKDFFEKVKKKLQEEKIKMLRISDFNTTGLAKVFVDYKHIYDSPWNNLVRSEGISNKSGTSGGSFGIGKNATFACSELRTVFYATKNLEGEEGSIGVTNLVSFYDEKRNDHTQGRGFLAVNERNDPIKGLISFDNFSRQDTGTDIYIAGFLREEDTTKKIIKSILDNYLVAVFEKDLEVKVNNIYINKANIASLISEYKEYLDQTTIELYELLINKDTNVYFETIFEENDLEIRLKLKPDASRKISMIRKPWMKIVEWDRFRKDYSFFGACLIRGNRLNAELRKIENPQHNDWEPGRLQEESKKRQIENVLSDMRKKIIDILDDLNKTELGDFLDILGAADFIPLIDRDGKSKKIMKVQDKVSKVSIEKKKPKVSENILDEYKEQEDMLGFGDDIDTDTPITIMEGKNTPSTQKNDNNFEAKKSRGKRLSISRSNLKIIGSNMRSDSYYILLRLAEAKENIQIKLNALDENGNIVKDAITILEASMDGKSVSVNKNIITGLKLNKGSNKIDVKTDVNMNISIGVEVYEF